MSKCAAVDEKEKEEEAIDDKPAAEGKTSRGPRPFSRFEVLRILHRTILLNDWLSSNEINCAVNLSELLQVYENNTGIANVYSENRPLLTKKIYVLNICYSNDACV